MAITYSPARPVENVARPIIEAHHAHLSANDVFILYLFTSQAEKVKGKRTLGTARKVSGLNAYLARRDEDYSGDPDFFVISVWEQWWFSRSTTDDQRKALVDHELCHLWSEAEETDDGHKTGKIILSLLPHDLEEFNAIVSRHGAWEDDVQAFLDAAEGETQPGLFDEGRAEDSPPTFTLRREAAHAH